MSINFYRDNVNQSLCTIYTYYIFLIVFVVLRTHYYNVLRKGAQRMTYHEVTKSINHVLFYR